MHTPGESTVSARRRSFALMAAVYGGLVLLLLLAAVFFRGFSRDVGEGRIVGRYAILPLFHSRTPQEATLTWNGLALHFARSMTPGLKGVESAGGSTDLVFDGEIRLRLTAGPDPDGSLTLSPVSMAGASPAAPIVVPFTVEGALQDPPAGSALAWMRSGRTFLLTLPGSARADAAGGTIMLPASSAAWTAVLHQNVSPVAAQVISGRPTALTARLPEEAALPSEDKLHAALAAYADAAYAGWSEQLAAGGTGFSEDMGVGVLAESVARGTWQKMFPLWSGALSRQQKPAPQAQSYTTSAYVGGVRDFMNNLRKRSVEKIAQVSASLDREDNSLLLIRGLVTLVADHGSPEMLEKTRAYLAGRTASSLDLKTSAGLAEDLVDYLQLGRSDPGMLGLLKEIGSRRILPAVRNTASGLFLDSGAGRTEVQFGIFCGALLVRAGGVLDSSLTRAVGRALLASSVSLADEKGVLPATLVLVGGRIASREGELAPESVYPLLPLASFLPRETSLASQLGPGAWVWTSAGVASARGNAGGFTVTFSYPAGVPYHLIIQGIRPFALLKLHGIAWHSDPSYFKYSDGWTYDPGTRTLFLKVTGRSAQEVLDIAY